MEMEVYMESKLSGNFRVKLVARNEVFGCLSFQNEFNHPCSSSGFYLKREIVEGTHEMYNCYVF